MTAWSALSAGSTIWTYWSKNSCSDKFPSPEEPFLSLNISPFNTLLKYSFTLSWAGLGVGVFPAGKGLPSGPIVPLAISSNLSLTVSTAFLICSSHSSAFPSVLLFTLSPVADGCCESGCLLPTFKNWSKSSPKPSPLFALVVSQVSNSFLYSSAFFSIFSFHSASNFSTSFSKSSSEAVGFAFKNAFLPSA